MVASLLPLLPVAHGAIRIFDFGRLQIIAIAASLLCLTLLYSGWSTQIDMAILVMLAVCLAIQVAHILPFTPLWTKQTATVSGPIDEDNKLSVLSCNVKQSNQHYDYVVAQVAAVDPDIAVFMEVDKDWVRALRKGFDDTYFRIECPMDNSYGIMFACRLPVDKYEIRHLLNEDVPSIDALVRLPNGTAMRVIALHPEPPVPTRDTEARDAEILMVGQQARTERRPLIVTGDLNDVAWSRTTRRFLRISRLLDPRQGRGFFNSFDARYWFLRWPLDHIFHSKHFEIEELRRLPFVGSDHFPMLYRLVLHGEGNNEMSGEATAADKAEAKKVVSAEKQRDRAPVGEDWEG